MMIEYYKFEIKPWVYHTREGIAKSLEIEVQVNGERHTLHHVLPTAKPFESELEFFARLATNSLETKLRDLERGGLPASEPHTQNKQEGGQN